jgi:hypothetical protein
VRDQGCRQCQQLTCGDCGMHDGYYLDGVYHWADIGNAQFTTNQRPFACPVCNGGGTVSRPPFVAGDCPQWVQGGGPYVYPCEACNGSGIVWGPLR